MSTTTSDISAAASTTPVKAPVKEQSKEDEPIAYWYPSLRKSVDMKSLAQGYALTGIPRSRMLFVVGAIVLFGLVYSFFNSLVRSSWEYLLVQFQTNHHIGFDFQLAGFMVIVGSFALAIGLFSSFLAKRKNPVYLVDFAVFNPPKELEITHEKFDAIHRASGFFTDDSLSFMSRLVARTGLGDATYLPPNFVNGLDEGKFQLDLTAARTEVTMAMTGSIDPLFKATGIKPTEVDFVIANCSCFCPTPSIAATIVNHYKMRTDVRNYNLGGMGCSAGLISVDLAKDLLQLHPNKTALVFSMEAITPNWYHGGEKSMMLSNTLFRQGGAAVLMSNKPSLKRRAKYELKTTVRVITASDDVAFKCIEQIDDPKGIRGVSISRDLAKSVGLALKQNLTILGPQVLPYWEQAKFLYSMLKRKLTHNKEAKIYTPDFKKAFQHYCIHAGGRAIIDAMEKNLNLSPDDVMPSRATLYRMGNTSSSSIWYELNYIEGKGSLKKGDKVWQIAFGSGIKCNSAVWVALKSAPKPDNLPLAFTAEKPHSPLLQPADHNQKHESDKDK